MSIDGALEAGNILVLEERDGAVALAIRPDAGPAGWRHWFHFRAGPFAAARRLVIVDAGASTYAEGWALATVRARREGGPWRLVPTRYEAGALSFVHDAGGGPADYAPTALYPDERLDRLRRLCAASSGAAAGAVGRSRQGAEILLLTLGKGPRTAWIVARQHAGEMPASWLAEGVVAAWLDPAAGLARDLGEAWTVHVVPLANPDGHRLGQQRADAAGFDLNRQWGEADAGRAPEVAQLLAAMGATGCDLFLDVHADAVHPYVYVDDTDDILGAGPAARARRERFEEALAAASPDFQRARRYVWREPPDPAAVRRMAAPQAAERFGALGLTLELPLTDYDRRRDPADGWSPARSMALGRACLQAIAATS